MWPRKYWIYIIISVLVVLIIVLSIVLATRGKKSKPQEQTEVESDDIDTMPNIDSIILADVDDYDGYIFHPEDASYPQELLDKLEIWPVPPENKLPGRKYLYRTDKKSDECEWMECAWNIGYNCIHLVTAFTYPWIQYENSFNRQ